MAAASTGTLIMIMISRALSPAPPQGSATTQAARCAGNSQDYGSIARGQQRASVIGRLSGNCRRVELARVVVAVVAVVYIQTATRATGRSRANAEEAAAMGSAG